MEVAICDDDKSIVDLLSLYIDRWAESRGISPAPRVSSFETAESFLFEWSSKSIYDLIFVDISMGLMSGMTLAQIIRKQDKNVKLVFVTGSREHILNGYEVDALHYLLKPIAEEKVTWCLDKTLDATTKNNESLVISVGKFAQRFVQSEIIYFESKANYVIIHTLNEDFKVRATLGELEKTLNEEVFIRSQRSYIVNIDHVISIEDNCVVLSNDAKLPISKDLLTEVNSAFIQNSMKK